MYLVRALQFSHEIAKFDDSSSPISVYSITNSNCTCPAYSRNCKHRKILTAWQKSGSQLGAIMSDSATMVGKLHVSN